MQQQQAQQQENVILQHLLNVSNLTFHTSNTTNNVYQATQQTLFYCTIGFIQQNPRTLIRLIHERLSGSSFILTATAYGMNEEQQQQYTNHRRHSKQIKL